MTTNVTTVALLLDAGADINALDSGKRTPLHQAAGAGREAVVRLLVERKADATLLDANSDAAGDVASKSGFFKIVTLLRACNVTQLADIRAKAAGGDAKAQTQLGAALSLGKLNVAKDEAEALKWWRKAAEQNVAEAQHFLGFCYQHGLGVAQDYVEAVKLFRMAAAQNDAAGQNNLGFCYSAGQGVAKDYAEAARWCRLSAAQDHAEAQSNLGFSYCEGRGVSQDYVEAYAWFSLAARKMQPAASERDRLANKMSPQQIQDGYRRMQELQAQIEAKLKSSGK